MKPRRPAPRQAARCKPAAGAAVARLGTLLAGETQLTRALVHLLTACRRVTRAEAGTIYLRREETLEFAVVQNDVLAKRVGADEVRRRLALRPLSLRETSIASYVVLTRSTVNLRDAYAIPMDRPCTLYRQVDRKTDYRTRSMLATPLRTAHGRVFGVLQKINAKGPRGVRPFTKEQRALTVQMPASVPAL